MAASLGKFSCRIFSRFQAVAGRQKQLLPLPARQWTRYYATTDQATSQLSNETESRAKIVLPNRIVRSPTAVLEALAAEVGRDPLAPDYNYMDDPYLIPSNNVQKRNYSLAKSSGQKAAKWVIENFPDAFANEYIAQPRVDAFMSTDSVEKLLEKHGDTTQSLQQLIQIKQVEPAWELYSKLITNGTSITKELQQQLLELLCFYNGISGAKKYTPGEILYQRDLKLQYSQNKRTQKKTWKDDGPAMQLFDQMTDKDSCMYNAIVQGMCKYGATEDAGNMYNIMVDEDKKVSEESFNALISSVPGVNDDNETRWELVTRYLKDMQTMEVAPSLNTFNSILNTILSFGRWKRMKPLTMAVLGEMKECQIEPSLGSWALVIRIFYYTDSQTSPIIHDVIDHVHRHGPYAFHDIRDFDFFNVAMNKAYMNLKDVDLAKRIDAVLNTNDNTRFLGDAVKESQYYNTYLKLLCSLELLEETMEVYNRCIPHIFTPNVGSLVELLNAIELYDGHRYLPQIWSDMVLFDYTRRDDLMEPLFAMMASRKHEETAVQENCHHAVKQVRVMIRDAEEMGRFNLPVLLTGTVLGNWMKICLNSEDLELAIYYYDLFTAKSHSLSGRPSAESLGELAKALAASGDVERFMNVTYKMSELTYPVADLIDNSKESLELTDSQKQRLNMMK